MKKMRSLKLVVMVMALVFAMMGCLSQKNEVSEVSNNGKALTKRAAYSSSYATMYLRGTNNGWGTTAMTLVANNTWKITATFGATTTERFKFDAFANWATNFGLNGVQGGADIPVAASKTYEITFNDSTKAYSVVDVATLGKHNAILVMSIVNGYTYDSYRNPSILTGMTVKLMKRNTTTVITTTTVFYDTGVTNGPRYAVLNQLDAGSYTATLDGAAGNYTYNGTLDFDISADDITTTMNVNYTVKADKTVYLYTQVNPLNFKSPVTLNGMARTLKADLYKDGVFVKTATIDGTSIISATFSNLERGGNYTAKFATQIKNETDVTLPVSGNVKYTASDFTFTAPADETSLSPLMWTINAESINYAKTYPTMYFRGTPNSWGTTLMTQVGDNTWTTYATFGTTTTERFKFDALGNWALATNWGDNLVNGVRDGIADAAGSDIPVPASSAYTIIFNDLTKKYTMVPGNTGYVSARLDQDRFIISKGDTSFSLPASMGVTVEGYSRSETPVWTPALDVNKVGTTVYTAQYGVVYYLTVR